MIHQDDEHYGSCMRVWSKIVHAFDQMRKNGTHPWDNENQEREDNSMSGPLDTEVDR